MASSKTYSVVFCLAALMLTSSVFSVNEDSTQYVIAKSVSRLMKQSHHEFASEYLAMTSGGEEEFTSQYVENRSYSLYLSKDWKSLVLLGDSALEKGFDYYFLRLRLGIALYEQKKYLLAKDHFKKAIEFNSFEDLPKEYLFYCYFFTDHFEESRALARTFSSTLSSKLEYQKWKPVDIFSFDLGSKFATSADIPNASYANIALGHFIANRVYLYHAYTYYGQGNSNYWWKINQNQYYIKASMPLKNDWNLALSFHAIGRDLLEYPMVKYPPSSAGSFNPRSTKTSNMVESFSLKKNVKKFDYTVGSTVLWLDSLYQFQHDVSATYYPFANRKLALGAVIYVHTSNAYSQMNFASVPYVSFKPSTKISFFSSYLHNEGHNIAEWNGALVNNSPDLTTGRFTLNSTIRLTDNWDLSATYQHEMKQSIYTSNYTFNSFFIGLKFKP